MADAGWYPDPQNPGSEAYWDGLRWTDQRRPAAGAVPPPQASADETQTFAPIQPPGYGAAPWPPQPGWYGQPDPYGAGPVTPAADPARRRRPTRLLIAAGVVVVLAAAGLTTWLVWPSDSGPSITYSGRAVKDPAATLTRAESAVAAQVRTRHGASSTNTRCYFLRPEQPAQGTRKTDVQDSLACGPVLFIDGDRSSEYLSLPLTNTAASGDATLVATAPSSDATPSTLPSGQTPVRPDGLTPPAGTGGLKPPTPPAAAADLLTTVTSLGPGSTPRTLADAKIVGRNTGVEVTAAGYVSRYGAGDAARSAPSGQRLLAFRWDYVSGEFDDTSSTQAQLVITDGGTSTKHTLGDPSSGAWVVAALPTSATATLTLPESGLPQSLSLPAGKPGSSNVTVLARANRTEEIGKTVRVPVRLSNGSNSESYTAVATLSEARLGYWAPTNSAVHASSPKRALLSVGLNYTDSADPGSTFGFPTGVVSLRLPDGTVVKARNASKDPTHKVANVFDVPASFTRGTLVLSGTSREQGITFTVRSKGSFAISIAAG